MSKALQSIQLATFHEISPFTELAVSDTLAQTHSVSLPSQCLCTRIPGGIAINNIDREKRRTRRKTATLA